MSLNLNDREWHEFNLSQFFDIKIGKNIDGNKVDKTSGQHPYITRKESNNGNDGFLDYDNDFLFTMTPVITIGNETAAPFVQPTPFFTGTKVNIMKPKKGISEIALFFISQCIKQQKNKFSYSYTINSTRLKRQAVLIPITDEGKPDWQFMEQYTKSLMDRKTAEYLEYCRKALAILEFKAIESLEDKEWHEFFLKDIFETVQRGKRLTKANQVDGKIPYVSSTALNNGVDNFIGNESGVRLFSDCLTIANSGSVGSSFYHPYGFIASDHVTHLKNATFSSFVYLFVATQTNSLSGKYNFNREINDKRISRDKIMLPVNDEGEPDYKYMEQYMMNLEYKKRKEFIDFSANEKLSKSKKANKKIQRTQKDAPLI